MGSVGSTIGGLVGGIPGAIFGGVTGPREASTRGVQGAANQLSDEAYKQRLLLERQDENHKKFADQLADKALGKGPSLTDMQMRAAQERSLAQQLALAKSNRSVNPGLASRNAAVATGNTNAAIAQAAAQARLQEQLANQNAYGNYLGQQQNYAAHLMTGQGNAASQAFNANAANSQMQNQFTGNMMGAGASMLGSVAMMSDENEKKNISTNEKDMSSKSFLDALTAYSYEYKNPSKPGAGEGRFLSVMAQDLEKAGPVGRSMVQQAPTGEKVVDYGKGFGAILAAAADLNKRLEKIEKRG
jgi:hypothetical protein